MSDKPTRLVTIGISHYCEKARWALDLRGLPYREDYCLPVLHMAVARRLGGKRTVPVLVDGDETFNDSTDILKWADGRGSGPRLYPEDGERRREVEELEDLFDEKFGPHVRRLVYWHILDNKPLLLKLVATAAPPRQWFLFRLGFPLIRGLIRKGLRVTPDGAERSRQRCKEIFAKVDALLADGRRYLVGDAFSAADLSFAALAAPLALPESGYGVPLLSFDELPAAFADELRPLRESAAGQHVLRMYREHREARDSSPEVAA